MKTCVVVLGLLSSLTAFAAPEPCSISMGITTRLGGNREWANALEELDFQDKGYDVCQLDAPSDLIDDEDQEPQASQCVTEFHIEVRYRPDWMTRNITITKDGKALFSQDYPNDPTSQKILKTIPTCADLQKKSAE